jgi:DNA-directed RNA polymerase alpha subunit
MMERETLSFETKISDLSLTAKERHALEVLGINTVDEFLRLNVRDVFSLRGYGQRTYSLLRKSQAKLHGEIGHAPIPPGELTLQTSIAELPLSVRGLKALRLLDVHTVGEFLSLDLRQPLQVRNCGVTTYQDLVEKQALIAARFTPEQLLENGTPTHALVSQLAMEERCRIAKAPITSENIRSLPFFSGEPLDGIVPADLHKSYHPEVPIEYLSLTGRATRALREKGITRLGELLLRPVQELHGRWQCGIKTLRQLQQTVAQFLESPLCPTSSALVDGSSPEAFVLSMIAPLLPNARQRTVFLERLGLDGQFRTLEQVGQAHGLTKERIRQIEKAAIRKLVSWRGRASLSPLHDVITAVLHERGPLLSLRSVSRELQRMYGWTKALHPRTIEKLMPAFLDLKCVSRNLVSAHDFRCTECQTLPTILEQVLEETGEPQRPVATVGDRLVAVALERCTTCDSVPTRPSGHLVRMAFERSPLAQERFHLNKKEVWRADQWRLARGPLAGAVEVVLQSEPEPISYKEVYRRLREFRQKPASKKRVWNTLRACTANGSVLLWDRGGIYRHKCHVNLYAPVLNAIEKWVVRTLQASSIPQMSAFAAFRKFRDECIAVGITSEYAVHSCLKHRQHPKLAFYRYANIGLASAGAYRIPNIEIAEEFIRQEGDTVSLDKLKKLLCGQLGLKSYQFAQILEQLDNVIRTEHGVLYAEYFDAESPGFKSLVTYATQRAARDGEVSAELIYSEKTVSCLQLRIDGPRMLYYLLDFYASDQVTGGRYPIILRKSQDDAGDVRGVRERVARFIREKHEPVSCEELRARFVSKLGFRHSAVMSVMVNPAIVRYLRGFLVHVDTIAWNDEKQAQLASVAETYYDAQVEAGATFARVDYLLEVHESSLPALGNGVTWTPTLLGALLSRDTRTPVLGTSENAFVFNKNGVAVRTFADFVELVLQRHFHGAASFTELSEWLRDARVIQKQVTTSMLRGESRLVVEGQTIRVRRTDEC